MKNLSAFRDQIDPSEFSWSQQNLKIEQIC